MPQRAFVVLPWVIGFLGLAVHTLADAPVDTLPPSTGTRLVYSLDLRRVAESQRARVQKEVLSIIGKRLRGYGLRDVGLRAEGADRLVAEVPGDAKRAKAVIGAMGKLTFHFVAPATEQSRASEHERAEKKAKSAEKRPRYIVRADTRGAEGVRKVVLENGKGACLDGEQLERARATVDAAGRPSVTFELSAAGAERFGELTAKSIGRRLAVVLDDRILQIATIRDRITKRGIITGRFSADEVAQLAALLRAGSLPVPLRLVSETAIPK